MPGCDWSLAGDRLTNRRRAFAVFSDARLLLMRDTTWRYDAIRYAWLPCHSAGSLGWLAISNAKI